MVGGYVESFAFVLLLPALAFLAHAVGTRTALGRWAASTSLIAGVCYVAITLATGMPAGAAALYDAHHGGDVATAVMVTDVRTFAFFLSLLALGLQALALGVAALSDHFSPRWTGVGGIVVGVVLLRRRRGRGNRPARLRLDGLDGLVDRRRDRADPERPHSSPGCAILTAVTGRLGAVSAALLGAAGAVVSVAVAPNSADRLTDVALALAIWTYAGVGLLIAWRHPGHRVGTCLLAGAAIWGTSSAALDVAVSRLRDGHADVGTRLAATLGDAGRGLGWLVLILVLPLLFPDGRPAGTPRVRRAAWSATAFAVTAFFLAALLTPTSNDLRIPGMDNPIGLPRSWEPVTGLLSVAGALAAVVGVVLAVVTLVQRWRRDDDAGPPARAVVRARVRLPARAVPDRPRPAPPPR